MLIGVYTCDYNSLPCILLVGGKIIVLRYSQVIHHYNTMHNHSVNRRMIYHCDTSFTQWFYPFYNCYYPSHHMQSYQCETLVLPWFTPLKSKILQFEKLVYLTIVTPCYLSNSGRIFLLGYWLVHVVQFLFFICTIRQWCN